MKYESDKVMLEYYVARFLFSGDYDKANPVTANDGAKEYITYLKEKEDELRQSGQSPLKQIVEDISPELLQSIRKGIERTSRFQSSRFTERVAADALMGFAEEMAEASLSDKRT